MKSIELKDEIHGYIEQVSEDVLLAIRTLVKPSIEQLRLTEEQEAELDKRWEDHLNGKSESYTWEEVKTRIKAKRHK